MVFKPFTLEEGRILVRLARKAVEEYLKSGRELQPSSDIGERLLRERYGVFTTIEVFTGRDRPGLLRGCIGFPEPVYPIAIGVVKSAIAAATEDPRFEPMRLEELDKVTFEVSVLSPMTRLRASNPREYLDKIVIGRHGLVVRKGFHAGLLLPQVPVEYCWDVMTFLNECCMKAFLPPDCWLEPDTEIYVYEAQVFKEVEPNGDVIERDLTEEYKRCSNVGKG